MFALIFTIVFISSLIVFILDLLVKNYGLNKDIDIMSSEINKLLKENSKLRGELKDVLQIGREGNKENKKSRKFN